MEIGDDGRWVWEGLRDEAEYFLVSDSEPHTRVVRSLSLTIINIK